MLSEISQVTKSQILHDFTYMKYLEEPNSQKQKVEQQLPGAGGRGNEELFKGYRVSSFQDETILKICCTKMCIQLMYSLKWMKILKIETILFKGLGALREGQGANTLFITVRRKACFFQLQDPAQCFLLTDDPQLSSHHHHYPPNLPGTIMHNVLLGGTHNK